jgi:hypothetical protein
VQLLLSPWVPQRSSSQPIQTPLKSNKGTTCADEMYTPSRKNTWKEEHGHVSEEGLIQSGTVLTQVSSLVASTKMCVLLPKALRPTFGRSITPGAASEPYDIRCLDELAVGLLCHSPLAYWSHHLSGLLALQVENCVRIQKPQEDAATLIHYPSPAMPYGWPRVPPDRHPCSSCSP